VGVVKAVIDRGALKVNIAIVYILISVIGGAAGQLLLKRGMSSLGPLTLSLPDLGSILWRIGTNPFVVGGLLVYVGSTLFWLMALSRVELSFAYPFASLSYIVMLVAAWRLFDENISPWRLVGTLVIGAGVLLIART
jgi:drug/metabolite transporter (DMT)-like permease